ncbi:MAG: glycosyltransferase family 2 protein, partial [Flavobacteriaceae bacterium]|nr:glycosyltransferase family 2 protein [Flavobacteriaceae bacterium]
MRIAVVILNWNGRELLERFLPSVVAHSQGANLYLADNASTDDSVSFTQTHFPELNIIQNKVNGGYAKGYNDALRHLDEDILVLLNSDVKVTPNWLEPIRERMSYDSSIFALQPKILDLKRPDYFEYAGAAGGYLDQLGYPYCRGRLFDTLEKDEGQYNDEKEIFWATGACLVVRRDAFNEAGGFDEDFFAHQEEIDL